MLEEARFSDVKVMETYFEQPEEDCERAFSYVENNIMLIIIKYGQILDN